MKGVFFVSKNIVEITGIDTNKLEVLSHEEMVELFMRYQQGDLTAKERLINGNLKLVLSIVKKFSSKVDNLDDLFQVGVIGLIKAIDNFDLSYNLKLSTYAVPLIIGEVKRSIRDNTSLRVSRSIKDLAYKIIKLRDELSVRNGKEPTTEEIAKLLNVEEYQIAYALDALKDPVSIFEPIYNDGGDTIYLEDQLADTKNHSTDEDTRIALYKALNIIRERERKVLLERYMIGKTQMEIADNLGISQAQVSRIEKNAINHIKRLIK